MGVSWEGHIIPWREWASVLMKAVLSSLSKVGLSAFSSALIAAITSRVLPAVLFGVEIWGLKESVDGLIRHSPYLLPTLLPVMHEPKSFLSLSRDTFNAPLHRLSGLGTFLELAIGLQHKLVTSLSPDSWAAITSVAVRCPSSTCSAWVYLRA